MHVAVTALVTEKTLTQVFCSHGCSLFTSLCPPNRLTTISPLCSMAKDAPSSCPDSMAFEKTDFIFSNFGSQ